MRVWLLRAVLVPVLGGPTVLAFFSGGYFGEARAWAGLVAWLAVVVALAAARWPLPGSTGGRVALAALAGLATWTLLSLLWAPIGGSAYHAGQLVVLYLGALLASAVALQPPAMRRLVEPVLAAGTVVVIGYALADRLLPGLLHYARSVSAEGRLEQPLTYWNAMGELAALGFVLGARICGDATRPRGLRALAGAACAPLGLGLYLSFSRGALFACAAGLVVLVAAAPRREQLRAIVLALVAGGLAAVAAAPFRGVTALNGAEVTREREGALVFVLLGLVMLAVGLAQWRLLGRERDGALRLPRRAPLLALGLVCAGLAVAVVAGASERSAAPLSPGASRYITLQSNRYAYWRVALHAFADQPLRGVGAGGWAVYWLRYRSVVEGAHDAHSLELQTLAELGLVGLALLAAFLAGIGLAARSAWRTRPALAAGPIAGCVTYIVHSPLDWDWQMPAVTLVAVALAGALLAMAQPESASPEVSKALDRRAEGRPAGYTLAR